MTELRGDLIGVAALDPNLVLPRPRRLSDARVDILDDDIYMLRVPLPYPVARAVNCYLLRTVDRCGWILVDCGSAVGGGWEALCHVLSLAAVDPRSIRTLLLTHPHPDHSTLAAELVARVGCDVWRMPGSDQRSMDSIRDPLNPLAARIAAARSIGVAEADLLALVDTPIGTDGAQPRPPTDRQLNDGDRVATAAGDWTVIATPGHCVWQLALFELKRGWLIGADAAFRQIRPYLEWGTSAGPLGSYRATLRRLHAMQVGLWLPGHGPPDKDVAGRIASAQMALAREQAQVAAALRAVYASDCPQGATAYELTCHIDPGEANPDIRGALLTFVQCVLEEMVRAGQATEQGMPRRFKPL